MGQKKLQLRAEDLTVTSFEAAGDGTRPGTVNANEDMSSLRTCASQCWSMCLADTDCCSEYPGECTANC
jgi:hypothetical protein